jgi:hypothetical protein
VRPLVERSVGRCILDMTWASVKDALRYLDVVNHLMAVKPLDHDRASDLSRAAAGEKQ